MDTNIIRGRRRARSHPRGLRRAAAVAAALALLTVGDAAAAGRQKDTIWRGPADIATGAAGWLGDGAGSYDHPQAVLTLVDGVDDDRLGLEIGSSRLEGNRTTTLRVQTPSDSLLPGVLPGSSGSTAVDATCTTTTFRFGGAADPQWFSQRVGTYVLGDARIVCVTGRNTGWVVDYHGGGADGGRCVAVSRRSGEPNGTGTMRFEPQAGCRALVREYAGNKYVDEGQRHVVPFQLDVIAEHTA